MASPVADAGRGLASLSFSEAVSGGRAAPSKVDISFGELKGVPAVFISDADMLRLAQPFALSLIGKFAANRPPVDVIRNFLLRMKFSGQVFVDPFDKLHVVFRFSEECDYSRFFARRWYRVFGCVMKVVKWSPFHDIAEEIPILPLWISFPGLRQHLFHRNTLMEIASVFGKALCVDFSPASRGNMTRARVLVEIDVSETHPAEIWIGSRESGAFQRVVIEDLPPFCVRCRSCGHAAAACQVGVEGSLSVPSTPGPPHSVALPPVRIGEVCCSGLLPCVQGPSVVGEAVVEIDSAPLGASRVGSVKKDLFCPPVCQAVLPVVVEVEEPRCVVEVGCTEVFSLSTQSAPVFSVVGPLAGGSVDLMSASLDRPDPPCAVMIANLPCPDCVVEKSSPCVVLGGVVAPDEAGDALVDGPFLLCGASAGLAAAFVSSPSDSEDPVVEEFVPSGLELDTPPLVSGLAGGDHSPPASPLLRGYPTRGMTTRSMAKGGGSTGGAGGGKRKKKRGKTKYDRDMAIALQSLFKVPSFKDRSS